MIDKCNVVVIEQDAVGGDGKAEVLVMELLLLSGIRHHLLDHAEVHQRLSAEEIHLQIPALSGMTDQKIHGALARLRAHKLPAVVICPLVRKAVRAPQITVMGHMQAHCLYR